MPRLRIVAAAHGALTCRVAIRAFIGVRVEPTPALRAVLHRLAAMGGAVRPVRAENLHVTLRFLGNVEERTVPALADAVVQACRGRRGCDVRIVGVGAFPSVRRPATLWAGLSGAEVLGEIVQALADPSAAVLGENACEDRPWRAHLTLARVKAKPPPALRDWLREFREQDFGPTHVRTVDLVRSELLARGPRYTTLATAPLE